MSSPSQIISCGCCVCRCIDGRVQLLLVKPSQSKNAWGIPKGHLNGDESFRSCAIRETKEETGITPHIISALPPAITKYAKGSKIESKTVFGYFAVQEDENEVPKPADGENSEVRYFDMKDIPPVHKYQVELIASAFGAAEDYFNVDDDT